MLVTNLALSTILPDANFSDETLLRAESFIANCLGMEALDLVDVEVPYYFHDCSKLILLDKPIMSNLEVVYVDSENNEEVVEGIEILSPYGISRKCYAAFAKCCDIIVRYESGWLDFNSLPQLVKSAILRYLSIFPEGEFNGVIRGVVGDMEFWTDKDNVAFVLDSICQSLNRFKRGW